MTTIESALVARKELGLFLRGFRENFFERMGLPNKMQLSRRRLAGRAGTTEQVIINLEHGIVNPEREIFEKVIKSLKLPDSESGEAVALLNLFSQAPGPRKWRQRKHHAILSNLKWRQGRR